MLARLYRTDVPALVAALGDPAMLVRYLQAVAEETPACADRALLAHLRRLNAIAGMVQAQGLQDAARADAARVDELLTDIFAVATWKGWELPAADQGEADFDPAGLPRGLLGSDPGRDGAGLWVADPATVALVRGRQADARPEWHGHQLG